MNMAIKKTWLSILITIVITSNFFATCKKEECIGNTYQLKESWKIFPQKDSINIGDTLIFTSIISNMPLDYNSNKVINFTGNALIGTSFITRQIIGLNNLRDAVDSFDYFVIDGKLDANSNVPKRTKDLYWIENSGFYKAKFGIIARKKGNYSFTLPDALAKLSKNNNCSDGAGIILSNTNSNNNAYLSHPYYDLNYVPGTDSAHIFCIRVK